MSPILWILFNWKVAATLVVVGLAAFFWLTPVALNWAWDRRIPILIIGALFASHGTVAVASKTYFTDAAERARLIKENHDAQVTIRVMRGDAIEAERLRAAIAAKETLIEDLRNELTDPDRVCLDEPDVERLRRAFD